MPKLTMPSKAKPTTPNEVYAKDTFESAAEEFQRRADATADLNLYDQACHQITDLLTQRKDLRQKMSNAKPNSEPFWDLKRSLDNLDDQFYYWQGEKRDIMIEKQIAAMDRLTTALENRK